MTQVALQLAFKAKDEPVPGAVREESLETEAILEDAPEDAVRNFMQALKDLLARSGAKIPLLKRDADECLHKVKELDMGEASDLVGRHDHGSQETKPSTILSGLTPLIDMVDKAIGIKAKELLSEKGQEEENAQKLARFKTADALLRQVKALLEDYGGDIVVEEKEDEYDWVKVGVQLSDGDNVWEIDAVSPTKREANLFCVSNKRMRADEYPFEELEDHLERVDPDND